MNIIIMIPKVIQNLIFDYKYQLEISYKFKKCIQKINKINYSIVDNTDGINIYTIISQRDDTNYSIINTETTHTFIAETNNKIKSIITYNYGEKIIYD